MMDCDFQTARELKTRMGDPRDPDQVFSFSRRVADDEAELFPSDAMGLLNQLGLQRQYVPPELGGELSRLDHLGALIRLVAQRDLTVAISHAINFLGSVGVWLAGDTEQKKNLASAIIGGERVSMALTEEGSGSDLLNMETTATPSGNGYRLRGEKWLGNGFSRNRFVSVYARTNEQGGPRGYSLFLFDKQAWPHGYESMPKLNTLGVRAADISSIRFDAALPQESRIGNEGEGFEIVLKSLQLSRTLCGVLSVGALDTSLDIATRFALSRQIYRKMVADLPQTQKLLTEAWAELLIAESLTGIALRELHVEPQQASIRSSIVKYMAPTLAEQAMQKMAVVYGARYYLREYHEAGIFQKILRDNLLISLFDGSTQVNLHVLSQQLRRIAMSSSPVEAPVWIRRDSPLSNFDWSGQALSCGGRDTLLDSMSSSISSLKDWLSSAPAHINEWISVPLKSLETAYNELLNDLTQLSPSLIFKGDPQVFEVTRRYCVINAASAVLADWKVNFNFLNGTLARPAVLALTLQRLVSQIAKSNLLPSACYKAAFEDLLEHRRDSVMYPLGF